MSRLLLLPLAALSLTACSNMALVSTSATPNTINSTQTSEIRGTAIYDQGRGPVPPGTMTFGANMGTVSPSVATTDINGNAMAIFTPPAVYQETVATVTSTYEGVTGSTVIKINPSGSTCQFPPYPAYPNPVVGDSVSVAPAVTRMPNSGPWVWVYTVTRGPSFPATSSVQEVAVTFQKPVTLAASSGTVQPLTGANNRFVISQPTLPLTLTVTGSAVPGPRADWDILDSPPNRHALCSTAGPL